MIKTTDPAGHSAMLNFPLHKFPITQSTRTYTYLYYTHIPLYQLVVEKSITKSQYIIPTTRRIVASVTGLPFAMMYFPALSDGFFRMTLNGMCFKFFGFSS